MLEVPWDGTEGGAGYDAWSRPEGGYGAPGAATFELFACAAPQ
ncbi:hypothetical protein ACH4VS_25745 [Streptomyces hygroscopicus]|nr:hypothetical protein [Streptomyces hygroscopicus]